MGIACAFENQKYNYETLSSLGVALPIGRVVDGLWRIDADTIEELVTNKLVRDRLESRCKDLLDSGGAARIVELIVKL